MNNYCEEPRYGMYTTGTNSPMDRAVSSCGTYAEFHVNGHALCRVHALRAQREGKKVEQMLDADYRPGDELVDMIAPERDFL